MATKVKIINDAVQLLGSNGITSLESTDQFTQVAIDQYDNLVETEIAQTNWRFATKYVQLSKLVSENPTPYFKYEYKLPSDYIALWHTYPLTRSFEIYSNEKLYSNIDGLNIEYRYVPSEGIRPAHFANFISAKLAASLALTVVRNVQLASMIQKMATERYQKAIYIDNQSRPNASMTNSPVINVRASQAWGGRYV